MEYVAMVIATHFHSCVTTDGLTILNICCYVNLWINLVIQEFRIQDILLKFTNSSSNGIFHHLWSKEHAADFGSLLVLPELASFPGLPTIWFLTAYRMQKMEGGGRPANIYYMSDVSVYLGGHRGREASNQRIHFTHAFFVSNNKLQFFSTWIVTARPQDFYFGPIQLTSVGLPSTSAFTVSMYTVHLPMPLYT